MERLVTVRSEAMKVTRGQTVLLTGATGGLGTVIARRSLNQALVFGLCRNGGAAGLRGKQAVKAWVGHKLTAEFQIPRTIRDDT